MTAQELVDSLQKLIEAHGNHELVDCDNAKLTINFKYDFDETSEPNEAFVWNYR